MSGLSRPYVIVKVATSLNGMVACQDGSSQWITGEPARADSQKLRASCQGILVGVNTVLADDPQLTVRLPEHQGSLTRILLDPNGRLSSHLAALKVGSVTAKAPTIWVVGPEFQGPAEGDPSLKGVLLLQVPATNGLIDLPYLCNQLVGYGICRLMIEGGGRTITHFLQSGMVDRLVQYMGNTLIGINGRPFFTSEQPETIQDKVEWRLEEVVRLGNDVRIDYLPLA